MSSKALFEENLKQMTLLNHSSGCGGELTSGSGSIISPNYPLPYPTAAQCYWTITVNPGNQIEITFHDLNTEGGSSCQYDYVQVNKIRTDSVLRIFLFNTFTIRTGHSGIHDPVSLL